MSSFYCPDTKAHWPRCVALVDMLAFFPSIHQRDDPALRGKPVAVTNGQKASTIISSSYECREKGVYTGMKVKEAKKLCPDIIVCPSTPERYAAVSTKIMQALESVSPDLEIFSIDESFIDLKPVLSLYQSVQVIADKIRQTVYEASGGLNCSIGISEGKLTAKYCAKKSKGETLIVPPSHIKAYIGDSPIKAICGIGQRIESLLHAQGVYYCRDIEKFPMHILSNQFGGIGRRLYSTCLGHDPAPVLTTQAAPKTLGHGKVLPPATTDKTFVYAILRRLTERLCARLRRNDLSCSVFQIEYKTALGWVSEKHRTMTPSHTTTEIWQCVTTHFKQWVDEPLYQVQLTAISVSSAQVKQLELFQDEIEPASHEQQKNIDLFKDKINSRFGQHTLTSASELLLTEDAAKKVIAFNWNPTGSKNSL